MYNIFVKMIQRSDTTENWMLHNPILREGELGYDIDEKSFKIGDGVSTWDELLFYSEDIDGGTYTSAPSSVN